MARGADPGDKGEADAGPEYEGDREEQHPERPARAVEWHTDDPVEGPHSAARSAAGVGRAAQ